MYCVESCIGTGQSQLKEGDVEKSSRVRIEIIVTPAVCNAMIEFLRNDILPEHKVTACIEDVDVVRVGHFIPQEENVT